MSIELRRASIGQILKPPCTAMYTMNGFLVVWDRSYVVVRKDPQNKCVWMNVVQYMVEYVDPSSNKTTSLPAVTLTAKSEKFGVIQAAENTVWLEKEDPKPIDKIRIISKKETELEHKRTHDGLFKFSFDDDELVLNDLPKQAQILADIFLDIYRANGTVSWTEEQLEQILRKPENKERLHTKQDPVSVFRFYRPVFARKGFLKKD